MIDINSIDQGQVYMLYEVYKNIERNLENKQVKTEEDNFRLAAAKAQINVIEEWAQNRMLTNLHWTREEILMRYGYQPTLIIEFHPGSVGYNTFGKEVVGNVEFSEVELLGLLTNIQNKAERQAGQIRFKRIPEMIVHEISTADIFQLGGRR